MILCGSDLRAKLNFTIDDVCKLQILWDLKSLKLTTYKLRRWLEALKSYKRVFQNFQDLQKFQRYKDMLLEVLLNPYRCFRYRLIWLIYCSIYRFGGFADTIQKSDTSSYSWYIVRCPGIQYENLSSNANLIYDV